MHPVTSDSTWLAAFEAYAAAFLDRHEVPGAAIVVVDRAGVVYRRGFGLRDREAALPATPATVFGIASLSKSFTALTALVLQARGVLAVDDLVTDHLPGFSYPGIAPDVRVRHLLSHSSGLPPLRALDYAIRPSQVGDPASAFNTRDYSHSVGVDDYDELLAYLSRGGRRVQGELAGDPSVGGHAGRERPALAPAGAIMSYSNEGVALVGAVIERATGRPFPAVVRELVLEPLGMRATFDLAAARATGELTTLYTRTPDRAVIRSPLWEEAPAYLGTGFLRASADDLAAYLGALLGGATSLGLDAALFAELVAPRVWSEPHGQYAYGWQVRPHRGVTVLRHGGGLKGVSSHQGFVPDLGLGIAILTNLDEVPVKRLWTAALNLALGLDPDTPPYDPAEYEFVDVQAATARHGLVGVYASGEPWGRFAVVADESDGSLTALVGEDAEPSGRLAMLDEREFVLVTDAGAWDGGRFHLAADGVPLAVQHGGRWYDRVRDDTA